MTGSISATGLRLKDAENLSFKSSRITKRALSAKQNDKITTNSLSNSQEFSDIKWPLTIFKCSKNVASARFSRKNWTGARLLVLAKLSQLLACSDSRLLKIS